MFDLIADLDGWAQWLILVGGGAAVLAGVFRWGIGTKKRPGAYRRMKSDARAIRDTLVGRDPVLDSITGEEIRPAIPGIGSRVSSIEAQGATTAEQLSILTRAVADMAASTDRIDKLEERVTAIEQGHFLERLAGKAESIQLFSTIEAVAKADPPEDEDT